jgi:hypothetical protein
VERGEIDSDMKRGHIILIAGAVLLVAGITIAAVWGVSFAGSFVANNTLVAKTTINAGQSVSAQNNVNELDRPMSLTVGIDRTTPTFPSSSDIRLRETVTDPNGKVVSTNEFSDGFVTSFKPEVAGVYTVTITNLGQFPLSISGTFGYLPFVGSNGNPDINAIMGGAPGQGLGMIIAGGAMAATGIITLIVGGIVTVADSRAKSSTPTRTTSEGGITYRKD